MSTPAVLFLVFNRPEVTSRVFEAIKRARPSQLFIASDGPRQNHPTDTKKVEQVRDIVSHIDWDCDVKTKYEEVNLGIMYGVYSSISWFFSHVDEGIILEDDCFPVPAFFEFAAMMLEKYRHDPTIFSITGRNHLGNWSPYGNDSHFFSTGSIWGWASWRRAWDLFSLDAVLSLSEDSLISDIDWMRHLAPRKFSELLDGMRKIRSGTNMTWDYPWLYVRLKHQSLNVIPARNLITNIGGGSDATNTNSIIDSTPIYPFYHDKSSMVPYNISFDYIRLCYKHRPKTLRSRLGRLINPFFV